jgi:hypothetical protein
LGKKKGGYTEGSILRFLLYLCPKISLKTTHNNMAYRSFKLSDLKEKFGISQTTALLFDEAIPLLPPSDLLVQLLKLARTSPLTTEKAISEAVIYPILREIKVLNKDVIELFSGETLDADRSQGLNGECDFIFAKAPGSKELTAPILQVFEAKQGEIDKPKPLAQVSAQLIGSRVFNQKHKQIIEPLYGVCTSGSEWLFLKLEGNTIIVDNTSYFINDLPRLLGILQHIINLNSKNGFSIVKNTEGVFNVGEVLNLANVLYLMPRYHRLRYIASSRTSR